MLLDKVDNQMLARMFYCRRGLSKFAQLLLDDKITDYTVVDPIDYKDNEQKNFNYFDLLVETEKCYVYVTIKTGSSEDKQALYKSHYEFYKKLRNNHVSSLHINFIYGDGDEDYTIQKINTDFGDSSYLFEVADINMDKLADTYHSANGEPTKEELEFLREMKSKFVYNKNIVSE